MYQEDMLRRQQQQEQHQKQQQFLAAQHLQQNQPLHSTPNQGQAICCEWICNQSYVSGKVGTVYFTNLDPILFLGGWIQIIRQKIQFDP